MSNENQNKEVQIYLLELITKLADGKKWRHTDTKVLPDGRVIIQIKVEKKICKI